MAGTKPTSTRRGTAGAVRQPEALADLTPGQIRKLRAAADLIMTTFGSGAGDAVQGPLPVPEPAVPVSVPEQVPPAQVPSPRQPAARRRKPKVVAPDPVAIQQVAMHIGALLKVRSVYPLRAAVNPDYMKAGEIVPRLVMVRNMIEDLIGLYGEQEAQRAGSLEDKPPRANAA